MSARTKVVVELEVDVSSSWGDDCTVGQVRAQARKEAETIVRNSLNGDKRVRVVRVQVPLIVVDGEP